MARTRRAALPSLANLGTAIRRARKDERQWTQVDLADALGVDQATVSKWERGENQPDLVTIARLEDVLQLPRGQVLRWSGFVADDPLPFAAQRGRRSRPTS